MAPPSRTPERDPLNPMAYEQKKVRFVNDLTALTLCRGAVPACRRVARSASSDLSLFNSCIPVRSNANNGSECALLNFVMASAAFRLCGHHRGRHIALRMVFPEQISGHPGVSHSPTHQTNLWNHDECALRIIAGWIFVPDHMRTW